MSTPAIIETSYDNWWTLGEYAFLVLGAAALYFGIRAIVRWLK